MAEQPEAELVHVPLSAQLSMSHHRLMNQIIELCVKSAAVWREGVDYGSHMSGQSLELFYKGDGGKNETRERETRLDGDDADGVSGTNKSFGGFFTHKLDVCLGAALPHGSNVHFLFSTTDSFT